MYFSDEITLKSITSELVDGFYKDVATRRNVFADKKSVKRSEYYSAQTAGIKADVVFALHAEDYQGETEIEFCEDVYDVARTYQTTADIVEITCTRRSV